MDIKSEIDLDKLPRHVAVIMDGNGRWAKQHGKPRVFGHKNGVRAVRETTEAAAELGIEYLTLYAFSTENWKRPKLEVSALMTLLVETLHQELSTLLKNDVRLNAIGAVEKLPAATYETLLKSIESTRNNQRMTLNLALNYSGKWDILQATRTIAHKVANATIRPEDIDDELIAKYLSTAGMPDPELLIRTSGESRISNFLLWQMAYTELYFTPVFWPDFGKTDLYQAIVAYQQRERRFGKTSDQLLP
ncbi:MAG: isoprenyl transferase [Saprospiraceae bacterium]|jgi:undecaprenyl diphosphate synthase|nr:isoprenyl transferase [Saprospiraceae bacterium]